MGVLTATTLVFLSALGGVVCNIVASELYDRAPSLARWIIRRTIHILPKHLRRNREEEWAAHVNEFAGKISQVIEAIRFIRANYRLRYARRGLIERIQSNTLFALYSRMIGFNRYLWAAFMRYFVLAFFDAKCRYREHTTDIDSDSRLRKIERVVQTYSSIQELYRSTAD